MRAPCPPAPRHPASPRPCVQIRRYEKLETEEERLACSREIFDSYIMRELLACSHVSVSAARGGHRGGSHSRLPLRSPALLQKCHRACAGPPGEEAGTSRPLPGGCGRRPEGGGPGACSPPTSAPALSRTSRKSARTSAGTCSRNSSRGEAACTPLPPQPAPTPLGTGTAKPVGGSGHQGPVGLLATQPGTESGSSPAATGSRGSASGRTWSSTSM